MGFQPYRRPSSMSMQMLHRLAARAHARLAHFAHAENRFRLRLVVRAHHHLADEPDRDELDSDDPEQDREENDGATAQADAEHDPLVAELADQAEADERQHEPDDAEHVQRTRGESGQE